MQRRNPVGTSRYQVILGLLNAEPRSVRGTRKSPASCRHSRDANCIQAQPSPTAQPSAERAGRPRDEVTTAVPEEDHVCPQVLSAWIMTADCGSLDSEYHQAMGPVTCFIDSSTPESSSGRETHECVISVFTNRRAICLHVCEQDTAPEYKLLSMTGRQ